MAVTDGRDLFKKKKEDEKSENSTARKTVTDGRDLFMTEEWYNEVKDKIVGRVENWITNSNDYLNSASNRYKNYNTSTFRKEESQNWLSTITEQKNWFTEEAKNIDKLLADYGRYLGEDFVTSAKNAISDMSKKQDEVLSYANQDIEYWSQFDSADAYNKYLEDVKKYEAQEAEKAEMISTNLDEYNYYTNSIKLKAEYAQELENRLVEIESDLVHFPNDATLLKEKADIEKKLVGHSAQKYWSQVEERNAWSKRASYLQTGAKMTEEALKASDFEQYSKYVSTEAQGFGKLFADHWGNKDTTYEYINGDEEFRSEIRQKYNTYGRDNPFSDGEASFEEKGYDYLNEKEKQIYNYYYAKEGKEKAEQYLNTLAKDLQERKAVKQFEKLEGRTGMEILFGVEAGIDQFVSGIKNLLADGDSYIPTSSTQLTSGMVREDLADNGFKVLGSSLGQIGYDAITNTANMLPSMLTSTVVGVINPTLGAVTGNLLLGASASGNAYAEMINLGYSKGQAATYAALVGGSEAGLQYLLGGIGKLGGTSKLIESVVGKIDNTFGRVALGLVGQMASEGFEEGLQTVLEPWFKSVVSNVDFEAPDTEEVLYSSLLGALTAGVLEGGGSAVGGAVTAITDRTNTRQVGKEIKSTDGALDRLTKLGSTMSLDSAAYKLAGKVNKKTGAYTIGKLFNEIGASMSEANKTDVANALMAKGMTDSDARTISEWLAAAVEGHIFNKKQIAALESNDVVSEVFRDVIIDQNSTVNQRIQGYSDIFKIADEVANGTTSSLAPYSNEEIARRVGEAENLVANGRMSSPIDKYAPVIEAIQNREKSASEDIKTGFEVKDASKREFTSSADGKTVLASTGEEVSVKSVASTKDGKMTLKLENGEIVSAKDISYSSQEEALVYESVADMGVNPATATALIKGYDGKMSAITYIQGIKEAYTYGKYNFPVSEMSGEAFSASLTEAQRSAAYKLGQIDAKYSIDEAQKSISNKPSESGGSKKKGKLHYDGVPKSGLTQRQDTSLKALEVLANALGIDIHLYESKEITTKDGKKVRGVRQADGSILTANGYYKNGSIYLDINAGASGKGTMLFTAAHELTHFIKRWSPEKFKVLADFLMEKYGEKGVSVAELVQRQITKAKNNGRTISYDVAFEEVVADSMEAMLTDGDVISKLAELKAKDRGIWEKIKEFITNLCEKIKALYADLNPDSPEGKEVKKMVDSMEQLKNLFTEALVEASSNYSGVDGSIDLDGNSTSHLMSERSMVEGAGLQFIINENGSNYKVLDKDGKPVKSVTAEMIVDSPLGNLVTMAKNNGYLGKGKEATKNAQKQYGFLAELVNMCINYNGIAPVWETAGTMVFSSMKSNADKQYGLTVDFSTVCKKTQAIVDAMSEAMLRLGRGLTRSEVETIYLEVGKAGESTPCPVCYVFSRWMGIGGILDQISRFQDKYTNMSEESLQEFIADIKERINERANTPAKNGKLKSNYFNAKGEISEGQVIADLKSSASNKAASALKSISNVSNTKLQIQELEALMKNQDAKEAKKTAKKIESLQKKLIDVSALEKEMREANDTLEEYEAYQWLTRTLMMESEGKWVKNSKFKPVPKDILFDLNKGDKFAEGYPLSWAFRTGKGASAGKAIVPYADARVGEAIQTVASGSPKDIKIGLELNPFLNSDTKGRLKILKSAIEKQARQNLIGGQRYQSTSDFRYEYGSDYLITFLEMQAIGAKVQLYTKVIEAVDFLASMGADCNLSVMPLSDGFITLPDGTKKLVYSSVTGIDAEAAIKKSHEYNNVQLILVGISDEHIRLALEGLDITFVIPFHGSGNSVHQIQALMNLLGENLDVTTAQDYTAVQSDHVSPNRTKEQKAMWDLRVKIIQGKASSISTNEQALLDKNPYLKDLYRRFYIDSNAEEYHVNLTSGQSEQIFPYEYWDKSLTYAEADKNGERFKEYCASMGIIPRFSGKNSKGENVGYGDFTNNKGYWKLLIDRPMYDNTYDSDGNWTGYGKYHEQARINCSNFQVKHLDPEYGSATYGDVMSKENDPKKTNKIVDAALKQFENNTLNDVRTKNDLMLSDRDSDNDIQYSLRGVADDGKKIYESNFPKGTPKSAKSERILDYIQKVWSKEPIRLVISNGETSRTILAQFDPTIDESQNTPTDASKIAGGNRHGTHSEQRVTLDLADDYYEIASEATYNYSKLEIGKDSDTHTDVKMWHYFVNDIYFAEYGEAEYTPYTVTINVKEKDSGDFVYSFNAEKESSTQRTLHAAVNTYKGANGELFLEDIITHPDEKVNTLDENILLSDRESYQEREADTSNRAILANAFESVAQNDIEKQKIAEYKEKISLIEEEQRQLAETRAKIKEISFSKGKRDEKLLKSLKFDAVQAANRINTYDKQLLRLEASKPLADVLSREKYKVKRRMEQKSREALAEQRKVDRERMEQKLAERRKVYRERMEQKLAEQRKVGRERMEQKLAEQRKVDRERMEQKLAEASERYQESRHRAVENRNRTELRHKIKNVVSELNKLLLNGSKEHNVKINLQKATAEALMAVNMDTINAEERLANIQSQIDKEMAKETPDMAKVKKLKESYDNVEAMGEKMTARLTALKDAYEQIKDSDDPLIAKSYDEAIAARISNLRDKVGDTPLRSMTLEQLEFVYDTYRMVLTTIRDANKAFNENIKMTRLQLGSNTFAEIKDNNKARETIKHENLEKFMWQNLKPMTAMKTIGSKTLQMLYNELLYGQEVFAKDYDEAVKFAEESKKKHGYDKWDMSKTYSFQSKSGKVMKLNLEQMMSVYAYSKRKQADAHIEKGGIVLNESVYKVKDKLGRVKEIKVNDSNAYRLSKDQVAHIVDTLEKVAPNSKAFVDEMQKYLSDTMGAKGNEVSLKMYGIKLFKETHYFPLKSSKEFMEAANTKLKGDVKIKNKGMTKETVPDAKNPIVLEGFLDVWGNHVNEMSLYHGLVLPLEDFERTLNYSFRADEKANVDGESINKVLHDAFGESATDYLHNLMKHINGGVLRDSTTTFADKAISKFKKGAVMASLSVVVQQPTAIVRAMAHINPKYFVHSPNLHHFETWEELKKYCPTAIIKETGSFDTNMGRSIVEMVKDEKTAMTRIDDFLSWLPAHADVMGWNMIWKALKNKIATEQKLSGEALLKAAGKQMTLIINETQVYDSVMARSELMRSKDGLSKMATSFMAEPTAVANMVYGAGLDLKRGQVGKASATVAAVMSSIVLNSIVSSLVYALRDDDEDKTYWEKYLESLTTEVVDGFNPLTYIPYIKDVYSVFQGYDVKRTDMSIFADLNDSLTKFYKLFEFDAYEDKSEKEIADYVYDNLTPVIGSICNMFGLPLENVLRDTKAVFYNSWHSLPASQNTGAETWYAFRQGILNAKPKLYSKIFGTVTKSDKVYEAILSGDEKQLARIKSQYKTEEAFESAIRNALRENDPRIKEAAIARFGGDIETYKRLVTEIVKEGHFKQDFVVGAVNTAMNKLDKDKEETEEEYEKQTSIFSSEDLNASLERGDIESAKEIIADLVKVKTENNFAKAKAEAEKNGKKFNEKQALKEAESKANSSVKSSMTSHWKPLYKKAYRENNTDEMKRIRELLYASGIYGRASEVVETVKKWLKED